MSTIGMKPGDFVLVIEHRDNEQLVRKGLAVSLSMDEQLAGAEGQCAITASFVGPLGGVSIEDVVHISHRDWLEGRAGLAYEELPHPLTGVCRFCSCTEQRACPGGCTWMDLDATACSAPECRAKFAAEYQAFAEMFHV